jgi:hypothetical protein
MDLLTVVTKGFNTASTTKTVPFNSYDESDKLNDVVEMLTGSVVMAITPATKADINASGASAGTSYKVYVTLKVGSEILEFANYTLGASIGDTIADADTTPTIDDATPTMANGVAVITVTLPEGTYVADETVTVTIANLTLPDGRTVTGGTSVLTIAADPEG